jgi:cold shock CspA family protein
MAPVEVDQVGVVKWFNPKQIDPDTGKDMKNFGFIRRDHKPDAFVHGRDINPDHYPLQDGDRVSFDVVSGEKGDKAVNVNRIG